MSNLLLQAENMDNLLYMFQCKLCVVMKLLILWHIIQMNQQRQARLPIALQLLRCFVLN